jgi:hypothetical protein
VDTRTKIVTAEDAAAIAAAGAIAVSGYFDPLTASHAERLAGVKRDGKHALLVLIATPENPILPAQARAELVASLGVVDYVTELDASLKAQIHLEEEDQARFGRLLEHVHARQRGAS